MNLQSQRSVLIVDDDRSTLKLVCLCLAERNFAVRTADRGEVALQSFQDDPPDLVILDVMMPEMDGFDLCRRMRRLRPEIPIIFLTALGTEQHVLRGFDSGAVDYVTKPFTPSVLIARVNAALQTATFCNAPAAGTAYSDDRLEIDLERRLASIKGESVKLTKTEARLLRCLLSSANRTLTVDQILDEVWGWEYRANPEYVHSYIWRLRQKLEPDPHQPVYLLSESGTGYRFESRE